MKVMALLVSLALPAFAGIKIPKGVFSVSDLDAAHAKAAEDNKPLVYVLTNPDTT